MSVSGLLDPVKDFIGWDKYQIDDFVFRLHSKLTVVILLTFSIIVTASQFIGDPIDCVVEDIPSSVMDTYCWIHSTFTLPSKILLKKNGETAHPGVGVPDYQAGSETYHKYYQWVCFTLFFQMLLFRFPRSLWHHWEGSRMDKVMPTKIFLSVSDKRMPNFPKPAGVLDEEELNASLAQINEFISQHIAKSRYSGYFIKYQICEWMNLLNVIFQMVFVDLFLGGMFSTYGMMVFNIANLDPEDRADPMNLVFPKVAKCTFRRMGPSGTVQNYDGLCVLPINIFNEKIYIFLWFWFLILAVVTGFGMVYRAMTLFSPSVRSSTLRTRSKFLLTQNVCDRVVSKLRQGDWFFLSLVGANLDPHVFTRLVLQLDKLMVSRNLGNGVLSTEKLEKIA